MMLKRSLTVLSMLLLSTFLVSCATTQTHTQMQAFSPQPFPAGEFVQKIDNFVVILDASQSMGEEYKAHAKSDFAIETVKRLNMTMPADADVMGSLRTFGHGACLSKKLTTMNLYDYSAYDQSKFAQALDNVTCSGGNSPLAEALMAAGQDLAEASGSSALIIVSDGKDMGSAPLYAAKELKEKLGGQVCFYTVSVGDDAKGIQLLKEIAEAGQCGYATNYESIFAADAMATFVKDVFLTKKAIPKKVVCPAAPTKKDSDGDGVYDDCDRCPGTPRGATVDQYGCWTVSSILFDFDKSTIKPDFYPGLDMVASVIVNNPGLNVEIQGHTCNIGPEAYNQKLSERRAEAVKTYLIEKGVSADQLTTVGYGLTRPIASNKTKEGRKLNRRVEFNPVK